MKFGVMFANTGPFVEPDAAVELAQAAEEAGCESIWKKSFKPLEFPSNAEGIALTNISEQ